MNKYLILLGLVLLASLSFAVDAGPDNWMQSVQGRYTCNAEYIEMGLFGIVQEYSMGTSEQRDTLAGYGMDSHERAYNQMYEYAGCDGPTDQSAFKAQVSGYNGEVSSFRRLFYTMLREYMAGHPEDVDDIKIALADALSTYRECIEDGPYCTGSLPPDPE